mgnify:FL=1|jgi:hypothetical protein
MCIQSNYTTNPITILYINEDEDLNDSVIYQNMVVNNNYIDEYNYNYPYTPVITFEYLTLVDEIHNKYKNSDIYGNIIYVMGTLISLYGIYNFIIQTVVSFYKKMNL